MRKDDFILLCMNIAEWQMGKTGVKDEREMMINKH